MKSLFNYSKDEKITEKAFSQSLIISVVSILLCLVALCSMTYAWFSGETKSGNNTLVAGSFDVSVSVETEANVDLKPLEDGNYKFESPGTYTVKLSPTDSATVKGYCIVMIDGKPYKTDVILDDEMVDDTYKKATAPLTFKIVTKKANTVVSFESHWGVLVDPTVKEDTVITVEALQTGN